MKAKFKSTEQHSRDVQEIKERIVDRSLSETTKKKCRSNMTFSLNYPHLGQELGIEKLDSIIIIDTEMMRAWVEPGVTMDQLVTATLEKNLMPSVVPEFKSITVGGAINGAAIESSSHHYGQFNDQCLAYEILLGNGELIEASSNENTDLFYGITGSFGSLALIVSVFLKLIPAQPWVCLRYFTFQKTSEALTFIYSLHAKKNPADFIEGMIFSDKAITIIEGNMMADENGSGLDTLSLKAPWALWYYQHVKKRTFRRQVFEEKMALREYLFRYDRGAFWMGSYAVHWHLLLRYFLETQLKLKGLFGNAQDLGEELKNPGIIFRSLFGWAMSSHRLYKMLHAYAENWFAERFVVQDYFLPFENTQKFLQLINDQITMYPLWLCPVKATKTPQVFSPHFIGENKLPSELFIDVGMYGMPLRQSSIHAANKLLDEWTHKLNGRKMLYSYCYYSVEEFWNIYSKAEFEKLREKYHANGNWVPIDEKLIHNLKRE